MPDVPTTLETLILLSLRGSPSWGYALLGDVESRSRGETTPDIGTMYRTLARLMERGWVEDVEPPEADEVPTPGRPRRYYGVTAAGRKALELEIERMEALVMQARGGSRSGAGA